MINMNIRKNKVNKEGKIDYKLKIICILRLIIHELLAMVGSGIFTYGIYGYIIYGVNMENLVGGTTLMLIGSLLIGNCIYILIKYKKNISSIIFNVSLMGIVLSFLLSICLIYIKIINIKFNLLLFVFTYILGLIICICLLIMIAEVVSLLIKDPTNEVLLSVKKIIFNKKRNDKIIYGLCILTIGSALIDIGINIYSGEYRELPESIIFLLVALSIIY